MAITYVAAGTPASGTTTSGTVGVPAGVQAGDIVLVLLWHVATATITPPAGFTEVTGLPVTASVGTTHLYWKRLTAADSGSYTFTASASGWFARGSWAFRGAVPTGSPWEADYGVLVDNANATAAVNMDTTMPSTMGILLMGANSGDEGVWTLPSGWTVPAGNNPGINFNFGYKALASVGNTGSATFTAPNAGGGVASWIGALKPASEVPPTFIAEYESAWGSGTPKTQSVTVAVGDVLVVVATMENNSFSLNTPTMTGVTWTLTQQVGSAANDADTYLWTGKATQAGTFTLSVTSTGSVSWGFNCLRFSGSGGIGASAGALNLTTPSTSLTTTDDHSTIVAIVGDYNAVDGSSRTWLSINGSAPTEQSYYFGLNIYTVYVGRWADVGAAGAKTVGLSAPTGQKASLAAVEILGTTSGAASTSSALTVSLTASGQVGASASAAISLASSLSATSESVAGTAATASLPLSVGVTTTHRKDTSGGPALSLAVAIVASGSTGKASSASLPLAATTDSAGVTIRAAAAEVALAATITAAGLAQKASPSTLGMAVAITAAGYKGSGATVPTRWIRINGAWVKVPPTP